MSSKPSKPRPHQDDDDAVEPAAAPPQPDPAAKPGQLVVPHGLTAKQGRAVEALLREATVTRAAATAGVGERSLRRWLAEPAFHAAVLAARREAFGQAVALTQRYAPVAVAALVKVLQDPGASAGAKVSAAMVLLRFGREGIELDDLAERLAALERQVAETAVVVTHELEDQA